MAAVAPPRSGAGWERGRAAGSGPGAGWAGGRAVCRAGLAAERSRAGAMPELAVDRVVVHPLVLLSVVDHFNRWGRTGAASAALSHGHGPGWAGGREGSRGREGTRPVRGAGL